TPMEERVCQARSAALPERVGVLEFDGTGQLTNPSEVARLIDLVNSSRQGPDRIDKVVVLSLGWHHSRDTARRDYGEILRNYFNGDRSPGDEQRGIELPRGWLVLCVAWDSDLRGVRDLLTDLVPSRELAQEVGGVLDVVFFPITFWAKAAAAD